MADINTLLDLLQRTCEPDYLYRQLAEECTELAQAALKKVRCAKHEISPGAKAEIDDNYLEELADVGVMRELAVMTLGMQERETVQKIMQFKRERMEERLKKKRPESKPCDCFVAAPPPEEFRKWANFWGAFWDVINEQLEHVKEEEQ